MNFIDSFPGREIIHNGATCLYFGGTSYLGLQTDQPFQDLFIKNIRKYGTNYGASRASNVQLNVFKAVELHLAKLIGSQACVTLSSGYLAGQLVVQTMNSNAHALFYAPDTHAAVQNKKSKSFATFNDLNIAIRSHLEGYESTPVVFLDTIDTQGLNYPSFKALRQLPLDKVIVVADDSHGLGVLGVKGNGSYQKLQTLQPKELIICGSLGKGFGIQAGAIWGTQQRLHQFTNTNFYGGASPAAPAALATLIEADAIFDTKRTLLLERIQMFIDAVKDRSIFTYISNHPAFTFSNPKLAAHLQENNIIVTNFNYPTAQSAIMSRIVLSAHHTPDDIEKLTVVLNNFNS